MILSRITEGSNSRRDNRETDRDVKHVLTGRDFLHAEEKSDSSRASPPRKEIQRGRSRIPPYRTSLTRFNASRYPRGRIVARAREEEGRGRE